MAERNIKMSQDSIPYRYNDLNARNLLACLDDLAQSLLNYKKTPEGYKKWERFTQLIIDDHSQENNYHLGLSADDYAVESYKSDEVKKVRRIFAYVADFTEPNSLYFWKMMCAIVRSGLLESFNIIAKARWKILNFKGDPSISNDQLEQMVVNVQSKSEHVKGLTAAIVAFEIYQHMNQYDLPESRVFFETIMAVQFFLEANYYQLHVLNSPTRDEFCSTMSWFGGRVTKQPYGLPVSNYIVLVTGMGSSFGELDYAVNFFDETSVLSKFHILNTRNFKNCTRLFINNTLRKTPENWPRPSLCVDESFNSLISGMPCTAFVSTAAPGHIVRESPIGSEFLIKLIRYLANPGDKPLKAFIRELALEDASLRVQTQADVLAQKYYSFSRGFPEEFIFPRSKDW